MSSPRKRWSEHAVELAIGRLLRFGVALAALVVVVGAVIYLWRHGQERSDYAVFRGEPHSLRDFADILRNVAMFKGRDVIQLGLLLLIATPVMRVAFAAYAFACQRDRLYVFISLIVLTVLLISLLALH